MGIQLQFNIWKCVEYSLNTGAQLLLATGDYTISYHLFIKYVIRKIGEDLVNITGLECRNKIAWPNSHITPPGSSCEAGHGSADGSAAGRQGGSWVYT
jgi:hypothetical protein